MKWDDQESYHYVEVEDYDTLVPKDIEQAKLWWKRSASQGNEIAKERLQKNISSTKRKLNEKQTILFLFIFIFLVLILIANIMLTMTIIFSNINPFDSSGGSDFNIRNRYRTIYL